MTRIALFLFPPLPSLFFVFSFFLFYFAINGSSDAVRIFCEILYKMFHATRSNHSLLNCGRWNKILWSEIPIKFVMHYTLDLEMEMIRFSKSFFFFFNFVLFLHKFFNQCILIYYKRYIYVQKLFLK